MDGFIEILKIILPAVAVFFAAFLIVKRFLENEDKRREHDLNKGNQSITSPLRLQAYERIIIFLERINPSSLLVRVNKNGMNCHQFHMELIKTIKSEFEHNLSQQIYMSHASWELINTTKEEIIKLINVSSTKLLPNATSNDLAIMILNITASLEKKLPNDIAIEFIKKEVRKLF